MTTPPIQQYTRTYVQEPITEENYKIVNSALYHDLRIINPTITSKHIPVSTFKPTVLETFTPKPSVKYNAIKSTVLTKQQVKAIVDAQTASALAPIDNVNHKPVAVTTEQLKDVNLTTYTPRTYTPRTYTPRTYTPRTYTPIYNSLPKTVPVRGYYRKDGTYVRGHYRSAPRRR